jgi:hypothetical protein
MAVALVTRDTAQAAARSVWRELPNLVSHRLLIVKFRTGQKEHRQVAFQNRVLEE